MGFSAIIRQKLQVGMCSEYFDNDDYYLCNFIFKQAYFKFDFSTKFTKRAKKIGYYTQKL